MVVHFWPAFSVISRTTSFTRRSNSSAPGVQSGPRMAAFMLSASMFTRTERRRTFAWERMRAAVSPEPVKETTSSSRTWPNRSRAEPQMMEIAPGGKIKCVDENCGALCGHQKMLPNKSVALREGNRGAFLQHFPFRQRPADFRVVLHGVNGAIHVKRSVRLCGAQVQQRKPKILVAICR